jgi:hypothetical protein
VKVAVLKAELGRLGLKKSGKQADLVARIQDAGSPDKAVEADKPKAKRARKRQKSENEDDDGESNEGYKQALKAERAKKAKTTDSEVKPKAKRVTKEKSPDPEMEGPLASEVIVHQDRNFETGERRLRKFVPEPDVNFIARLKRIRKERMYGYSRIISVPNVY